jgi:integration host factor subunit alpha
MSRIVNGNQPIDTKRNFCERVFILPSISTTIRTEHGTMALTKKDIVDQVQEQLGFPQNKSFDIIESLLELIKSSLEAGNDVLVSGFGKFCVKDKAERKGRNPATGEDAILPARRVVTFKCSGNLRGKINGKR